MEKTLSYKDFLRCKAKMFWPAWLVMCVFQAIVSNKIIFTPVGIDRGIIAEYLLSSFALWTVVIVVVAAYLYRKQEKANKKH